MGNTTSCCKGGRCGLFRKIWTPEREEKVNLPKPPCEPGEDCECEKPGLNILRIEGIDFCVADNGRQHHTSKYEVMLREKDPLLVVRRGQSFILDLKLNRPYNANSDAISFIFTVNDAEKPSYGHGTLVAIPLVEPKDNDLNVWSAKIHKTDGKHLFVKITSAPDSIVAQWKIDVDSKLQGNGALSYSHPLNFYLLFNPWCRSDSVYIEGDDLREEYVMLDTGLIWRGTYNRHRPCIWKYAQYEKDVLDCSLYLVREIGKLKGNARGDAVKVSRAVSAAVNSSDDYGALMGNWSDDFGGGTQPSKWIGSMEILQTYYKKKKPVKYAQCWVFAGVLTTICRAIGIPSRVVTTFASAHDTQNSLTVDIFVDEKCNIMEEFTADSIWNFHVWNEVWMERPDLGSEYNGWQVIDATPQELSDNMFRCGPTSVSAIKLGEVQKPYDGGFLFSEVNADKVYWLYSGETQPLKLISKDVEAVGKFISTKAVGKWEREDITLNYKYEEKSKDERATMLKALKQSESQFSRYYLNEDFNEVQFEFALRDDIKIGQPFSVVLLVKNVSSNQRHVVKGSLKVESVTYMGKVGNPVKKEEFKKSVLPGTTEEVRMNVSFDEYFSRLVDQGAFNISCLATVADTEYEYFAQDDFRVRKPDVKITIQGTPTTGVDFNATIKLENSLPIPIKKGEFHIEGCGLEKKVVIKLKENVPPGEYAVANMTFTPPWSGRHTIAAKFFSKEMTDVDGFLAFMVKQKGETNGTDNNGTEINGTAL